MAARPAWSANTFKDPVPEPPSNSAIFLIVSTPTMVIVRPDGVVDSVVTLMDQNFAKTLEAKSKELTRPS